MSAALRIHHSWVPWVPRIAMSHCEDHMAPHGFHSHGCQPQEERLLGQLLGTTRREGRRGGELMRNSLTAESLPKALLTTSVTVLLPAVV